VTVSHVEVLRLAEQIVAQQESRIPQDARFFIEHYLETLRRLTMQDPELVELCKTIYRKHREAIDLIVEYGASSEIYETCEATLRQFIGCEFIQQSYGVLYFLPRQIGDLLLERAMSGWGALPRAVPVCCWLQYGKSNGRLRIVIQVGPMSDAQERIRLLTMLQESGLSFQKDALKEGVQLTRIARESQKLRLNQDGDTDLSAEYVDSVTRSLWKKLRTDVAKLLNVLKGFDWS
jgi:hypothetical protein